MASRFTRAVFVGGKPQLRETLLFYASTAVCLFAVGYVLPQALGGVEVATMVAGMDASGSVAITSGSEGVWQIFTHNVVFFSAVALMPVLNYLFFSSQFLALGSLAFVISGMGGSAQFDILYRHAVFEVGAIFVSVFISYVLFYAVKGYVDRPARDIGILRKDLLVALLAFLVVILLTFLGAILEGIAVVQL